MKYKIAIVVHGRFHAFDLARALLDRGHDVTLFTNYPQWAVQRFGIAKQHVRSFTAHGIISRAIWNAHQKWGMPYPEAWLHCAFGRWAAKQVLPEKWDLVHCWSGVAEEILDGQGRGVELITLMRGSAHIRTQARLLQEEEERTKTQQDQPSHWMIAREEREYAKADRIIVLSSFAFQTFVESGIPEQKLLSDPLGVEVRDFRPVGEVIEERCQRILAGTPLRVLYVGAKSFQKGMWDLATTVKALPKEKFQFRLVGAQTPETENLFASLPDIELIAKQPQCELFKQYAWGDLFLFPTIQDGFASVLAQANASALPILTTTNCGGPDLIQEGLSGWVLPIRNPSAIVDRLQWCDNHRVELAEMVRWTYEDFKPRTWNDTAIGLEQCIEA